MTQLVLLAEVYMQSGPKQNSHKPQFMTHFLTASFLLTTEKKDVATGMADATAQYALLLSLLTLLSDWGTFPASCQDSLNIASIKFQLAAVQCEILTGFYQMVQQLANYEIQTNKSKRKKKLVQRKKKVDKTFPCNTKNHGKKK